MRASGLIINLLNELQECKQLNITSTWDLYLCNKMLFYALKIRKVPFFADSAPERGRERCNISAKNGCKSGRKNSIKF